MGEGRFAVLIDFVPVATGAAGGGFSVGDRFEAELVYYPSSVPMRALIVQQISGAVAHDGKLTMTQSLSVAWESYEVALASRPWLGDFPLGFTGALIRRAGERLYLCDEGLNLPVARAQAGSAWALLRLERFDGVALWDGAELSLFWADTPLGRWAA